MNEWRAASFLRSSETELFEAPRRVFTRKVVPLTRGPDDPSGPMSLVSLVQARLAAARSSRAVLPGFLECISVEVNERDGMSWSAEVAARELSRAAATETVRLVNDQPGVAPPAILSLLGKDVLDIATEAGLIEPPSKPMGWKLWLGLLVLLALGVLGQVFRVLLDSMAKDGGFPELLIKNATFITLAAAFSATGIAGQWILAGRGKRSTRDQVADLLAKEKTELQTGPYETFIDKVAVRMAAASFPRFVVVDDFQRLDLTTQAVLLRYFETHIANRRGAEFWMIFDEATGANFRRHAAQRRELRDVVRQTGFGRFRYLRQEYLSDADRKQLATAFGFRDRYHFLPVGKICSNEEDDVKRLAGLLRQYRAEHPVQKEKGLLELLHLIVLGQQANGRTLPRTDLIDALTTHNRQRYRVFEAYWGGPLHRRRADELLRELEKEFTWAIHASDDDAQFQIAQALPEAFAKTELGLPARELGQLFWALFWHDKLVNQHGSEGYWIRQLAALASAASARDLPDAVRPALAIKHVDALLFAYERAVQMCLFEQALAVLRCAADVIGELPASSAGNDARVANHLWEGYSLLGDASLLPALAQILDRQQVPTASADERNFDARRWPALEFLPGTDTARQLLATAVETDASGRFTAVADHIAAQAAWLARSLPPHRLDHDFASVLAEVETFTEVTAVLERATQRVNLALRRGESPGVLDVATTAVAHWAAALELNPARLGLASNAHPVLDSLISAAETALSVAVEASYARARTRRVNMQPDFVLHSFGQELAATVCASMAFTMHTLQVYGAPDDPLLARASRCFQDAVELVLARSGDRPANLADTDTARASADEALGLSAALWRRFGMHHWARFVELRSFQFLAQLNPIQPGLGGTGRTKLGTLASSLDTADTLGVISNVVVAQAFSSSAELCGQFLCKAAEHARNAGLSPRLRAELALHALLQSHGFDWLPTLITREVVSSDGGDYLRNILRDVPDWQLIQFALRLLNVRDNIDDAILATQLFAIVSDRFQSVADEAVKREATTLIDEIILSEQAEEGILPPTAQVLSDWQARRDLWQYASVLSILWRNGERALAEPEILRTLERDAATDTYNTYFHLALAVGVDLAKSRERTPAYLAVVVPYLRDGIPQWTRVLRGETVRTVYWCLRELDPDESNKPRYYQELIRWEIACLERDQLSKFPSLIARGDHFLVFQEYVQIMVRLGVQPLEEYSPPTPGEDATARRRQIQQWRSEGGNLPPAFVHPGSNAPVSRDFLNLGGLLFSHPILTEAEYEPDRLSLNRVAEAALPELLDRLLQSPQLPAQLKELLTEFQRRLDTAPVPAGG